MVVEPAGNLLLGGYVEPHVVRVSETGQIDPSVAPNFQPRTGEFFQGVQAIDLQPDGKVLVSGTFGAIDGVTREGLARLHPDGTLDHEFNPGRVSGQVNVIAVLDSDFLVIGGNLKSAAGQPRTGLARFRPVVRPRLSKPTFGADGRLTLAITGESGQSYQIESSRDLQVWSPLVSVQMRSNEETFVPELPEGGVLFYRAIVR